MGGLCATNAKQTGIVEFKNVPIAELRKFIDWSPFFRVWGLMGGYPMPLIIQRWRRSPPRGMMRKRCWMRLNKPQT